MDKKEKKVKNSSMVMRIIPIIIFMIASTALNSFVGSTNFFLGDDPVLQFNHIRNGKRTFGARFEVGSRGASKNTEGERRPLLGVYNDSESIIKMMTNPVGKALQEGADRLFVQTAFSGPFTDDGMRGHVGMAAHLQQTNVILKGHYVLPLRSRIGWVGVGFYLPTSNRKVHNLVLTDHTRNAFISDMRVRDFVKDLKSNLKKYGNLDLQDETTTGLGDTVLALDVVKDLKGINHRFVKRASLYLSLGLSIPTGKEKDEDKVLSMPLGTDGTWGIPVNAGGWLLFKKWFQAGADVQVLPLLDKGRVRRLKTDVHQSDLLLLNKGFATKRHGLQWQVHPWLMVANFYKGLFARLSYQFIKHHEDSLISGDARFDNAIINTARNLRGWSSSNLILQVGYNLTELFEDAPVAPLLSVFYKLPVGGKGIVDTDTWGGQLRINF